MVLIITLSERGKSEGKTIFGRPIKILKRDGRPAGPEVRGEEIQK